MLRKSKGEAATSGSSLNNKLVLAAAAMVGGGGAVVGAAWAFWIGEETRTKIRKMIRETQEIPFRIFL